jgi:hypothetical protein
MVRPLLFNCFYAGSGHLGGNRPVLPKTSCWQLSQPLGMKNFTLSTVDAAEWDHIESDQTDPY